MKTNILSLAILSIWSITNVFAQDRTTVTANNSDISDNLDLRAVASIFGDSKNLDDFERRLNDPKSQISNLDLNGDNRVDYLRVIETVEGNTHLVIIQSVLGQDTFQDIATVEVERDRYNKVQIQVVGDVYMYGNDYIYEPVYSYTPVIYNTFWVNNYRPYYSSWYWGYYPGFYVAWAPFPVYTYHNHIAIHINSHHHYNYVNYRRCAVAYNNYYIGRRGNAYERQHPTRSFAQRNDGYTNRRELITHRNNEVGNTRNNIVNTRSTSGSTNTRNNQVASTPSRGTKGSDEIRSINSNPRSNGTRDLQSPRSVTVDNAREATSGQSNSRSYGNTRSNESTRTYGNTASQSPRSYGNSNRNDSPRVTTQTNQTPRVNSPSINQNSQSPRTVSQGNQAPRTESPRVNQRSDSQRSSGSKEFSQQRASSPRSSGEGNARGNSGNGRRG